MAKSTKNEEQLPANVPAPNMNRAMSESMPDFLREEKVEGLEELSKFIKPPSVKVVQKMARPPISDMFVEGDVIITPNMLQLSTCERDSKGRPAATGKPFFGVPLFFFPEWVCWNPLETKGTLPAVRGRTTDPSNIIARKAMNADTWFEPCPELREKNMRYVEHLNFIVMLLDVEELEGVPVRMGFAKGEHRAGTNFAGHIRMRRASPYMQVYQFTPTLRPDSPKGQWYGIDATAPSVESGYSPWVTDKALFEKLKEWHQTLKAAHGSGQIEVNLDDDDGNTVDAATSGKSEY